jgi:hypothetical protein
MFYCNGKKDFCVHSNGCERDCPFYNGEGGEDVDTRWQLFLFRFKQRLKALLRNIHRR